MEHTEKYLQAKWVTENTQGYDERDVVDAKRYCNAYLEGYNQALRMPDVGQRSELLAFMNFLFKNWQPRKHLTAEMLVDAYLKANCG